MKPRMRVMSPRGRAGARGSGSASDLDQEISRALSRSGRGKLAIIENGNANAEFVLRAIAEGVVDALGWEKEVLWIRKPSSGEGVDGKELGLVLNEASLVLAGTAD
ncbi:MAG: hypothetical protein M0Z63_06625 [Actinomycetota bacterium]|nr:hypothetical protein [Actinomycetota bacterium]